MQFETAKKVASTLAYQHLAEAMAERPIDKKTTKAAFEAGCKVAYAVGFGNTPFHVQMVVLDAHRDMIEIEGNRPGFNAANNAVQKTWDETFIGFVTMGLLNVL